MGFAKYWEIAKINFYNSLVYRMDFFASSVFVGVIIFILISLWKAIYSSESNIIEGFTLSMMIWYLVMTESIVTSPGRVVETIGDEIQSGNIAQSLNKPYNYVFYQYTCSMAKSLIRFFLTFMIGAFITIIFIGGLNISIRHIPLVLLAAFLALTLHFLMMAFIAVFALWVEDSKSMNFIYSKIVFVLGGMLLPLEIFPEWLARISKVMPFSYVAYFPAKVFVNFDWIFFIKVLTGQLAWILVMIIAISIAYKICFKKISINGG